MADQWKDVNSTTDETWNEESVLEGIYTEKRTNVGPNNSNMYIIKTKDDKLVSVWGCTVLDTKFENLLIGISVRIEFLGMARSTKTGKSYKDYKIQYKETEYDPA
jgi:hypothetical protein